MAIALMCPNLQCRSLLRVPEGTRGKRVRCPECGGVLLVPRQGAPQAAPGATESGGAAGTDKLR